MSDTNLTNFIVNYLTREELHSADFTDHGDELFVQSDHAGVSVGGVGVDALDTTNISNCITHIPQDVKLELNNGTLTLKAGSKLYVPNGFEQDGITPKFDTYVVDSDFTLTPAGSSGQYMKAFFTKNGSFANRNCGLGTTFSGTSAPTGATYMVWYDTANNIIKYTNNSGSTWISNRGVSLPVCIITNGTNTVNSLDQVFNGFGYIGSTVFALPGVKGLAPNGRNADGTLSNIVKTLTNVTTRDFSDRGALDILYLSPDNDVRPWDASSFNIDRYPTPTANKWYLTYSTKDNLFYRSDNGANYIKVANICFFGKALCVYQGNITSFDTYKTFRAVNYSDTEYIAHQATPSNRYVDLTLGASGTNYTAKADGYICLSLDMQSNGNAAVSNETKHITSWNQNTKAGYLDMYVPVEKGDVVRVYYTLMNVVRSFKMVFLNGSK